MSYDIFVRPMKNASCYIKITFAPEVNGETRCLANNHSKVDTITNNNLFFLLVWNGGINHLND